MRPQHRFRQLGLSFQACSGAKTTDVNEKQLGTLSAGKYADCVVLPLEVSPTDAAGELCHRILAAAPPFTRFDFPQGWIDYSHLSAGPDGNLWVVAQSRRSIFRITVHGTILEEIGVSDAPWDITMGPDRQMWFSAGKSIGRITV